MTIDIEWGHLTLMSMIMTGERRSRMVYILNFELYPINNIKQVTLI